jgi:hypothetical protein
MKPIPFIDYLLVIILSLAILMELLRLTKLLFNPGFLSNRRYDFPERRTHRVFYYLQAILVYLVAVLLKLDLI